MKRFSQLYIERGKPGNDSARMRSRLFHLLTEVIGNSELDKLESLTHKELGIQITKFGGGSPHYNFSRLYEKCDMVDLLDTPTIIACCLVELTKTHTPYKVRHDSLHKQLINETNRIFREENTVYVCDEQGIVHYAPDEEFEKNEASAIKGLESPRYKAAKEHYSNSREFLLNEKFDSAIREVFLAAESLAKLLSKADKLNAEWCRKDLKKIAIQAFGSNNHAVIMLTQLTEGYSHQIKGYHEFRHAQPTDNNASLEIAILAISNFISLIRFLIEIDSAITDAG